MASKHPGIDVLIDAGMKPKAKGGLAPSDHDGDEPDVEMDEDMPEVDDEPLTDGEMTAAEDLCRALDLPDDKAEAVGKALCAFVDSRSAR